MFCSYIRKDAFHPNVLILSGFTISFAVYLFTDDLFTSKLTPETGLLVTALIITFVVACFIADTLFINTKKTFSLNLISFRRLKKINSSFMLLTIIFAALYVFLRIIDYRGGRFVDYLAEVRNNDIKNGPGLIGYIQTIYLVCWCFLLNTRQVMLEKFKTKKLNLMLALTLLIVLTALILNTGKQAIYIFLIASVISLHLKDVKKLLIVGGVGLAIFIGFMFYIRGLEQENGMVLYYLAMYSCSALIAFQEYYLKTVSDFLGSNAFWFFNKISDAIFATKHDYVMHLDFVDVGIRTNVYTAFSSYVYYSIALSFLIVFIHGFISGAIWRLGNYNVSYRVFYALFSQSVFFMFFHEVFMMSISLWIQIIIISGVLSFVFIKKRERN